MIPQAPVLKKSPNPRCPDFRANGMQYEWYSKSVKPQACCPKCQRKFRVKEVKANE